MNDMTGRKTTRIVFIGAPGCGKSTLAADLFVALKKHGKNAELVPEWVRRDIMKHGIMTNVMEQYRYFIHNLREENHFPENVEYIIQDAGVLVGYFYAAVYSTAKDQKERLVIQDLYEALLDSLYSGKYDRIYFLPRAAVKDTGVSADDGTRYQSDADAQVLEDYMRLIFTRIHYTNSIRVIDCPLEKRLVTVLQDLEIFQPEQYDYLTGF